MKIKSHLLLIFLLICVSPRTFAQLKNAVIIRDTIYSNELQEKRALEIVLPADYSTAHAKRYDATYVTDGEWNTQIVTNIDRFLEIQFIPSNIIVSLPNVYKNGENMRERDCTPTHINDVPVSGGAAKYLAFIKNEVMPYINQKYRTSGMNTLYGSSLAGIFTMYALIKEPRLFQSYLLADPALWWDNGYAFKLADENLGKLNLTDITMLMTGREGAAAVGMGIVKMDSIFRIKAPAGMHWKTMYYQDETHNSMIFRTLYDGLKYTYYGYSKEPMHFHPENGVILKDQPVKINFSGDLLKELRYTTDGSEPTAESIKVEDKTITLQKPGRLIIKAFSNRPVYAQQDTANFVAGTALPAKPIQRGFTPDGFNYDYYEGSWDRMPDFKKLKPLQTGKAGKDFRPNRMPKQQNFALKLTGQIEARVAGYYIFGLDCNGGAKLYLGDKLLIDYDGIHTAGNIKSYVIPLEKGFHNFRLEYFEKTGSPELRLLYSAPDNGNGGLIPLSMQYGK
jgi:predicted alpha/beta superfamily hydrolase